MLHPTELRPTLNELHGCQERISFHCTSEALTYNIPRLSPQPAHPCKPFGTLKNTMSPPPLTSEAKEYNVPCHHSCIDPTSDVDDTYVEKTPRKSQFGKKIRRSIPLLIHCNRVTAGGTQVRLKQRKVHSHPPSSSSPSLISPSLIWYLPLKTLLLVFLVSFITIT